MNADHHHVAVIGAGLTGLTVADALADWGVHVSLFEKTPFLGGHAIQLNCKATDACVKCGACTDKCHYFLSTKDPKNMPVARQDLLRKVYRRYFTFTGKYFPKLVGATDLTREVLDEWYSYYHQCSQCRRCSVFCPYGIDTAEITMMAREIFNLLGLNIDWIATPVSNCYQTGNHLGIQPHAFKDMLEFFVEDIEEITGIQVEPSFNRKGADILFITPSGDVFADPGTYSCMGYLMLFGLGVLVSMLVTM